MTIRITESVWLNASDICSLEHVVEVSGLDQEDILDLVATGVLRDDFELDSHGLALAMRLLDRIDGLQAELQALRARLPHHGPGRTG
jgi:chaperone modulatory protein CbpM